MVNSREKGKRAEREARDLLRALGFLKARRGQQYSGTETSADITDAIPEVHIEVKHQQALNIWKALRQAEDDMGDNAYCPLVLFKRNRSEWYAALPARLLVFLAARIIETLDPDHVP